MEIWISLFMTGKHIYKHKCKNRLNYKTTGIAFNKIRIKKLSY